MTLTCSYLHWIAERNNWTEDEAIALGYEECTNPVYVLRGCETIGEIIYLCRKHDAKITQLVGVEG
jgi:hypothetical protein